MSLGNFAENELLDALLGVGSYVTGTVYVSLHTGDPGETGASEMAGGSYARDAVTFGAAAGGSASNTSQADYTLLPAGTVTHFGLWDAVSSGDFLIGGALDQSRVYAGGENDNIPVGGMTISLD